MKRILIGVALLALLLVVAPWGIGKVAESRVDASLEQLIEAAPYLTIAERRYTAGWFSSEQEVTFEVTGPRVRAIEAPDAAPPRFTVRNEILHGPVLGFSGFGIARVNSRILPGDALRQKMMATLGTDEPLRVSTRIGFFGGRTTTLTSEPRKVKLKRGATELSWDDLSVSVSYSRDLDSLEIEGDWPRVALRSLAGGPEGLEIEGISMEGASERIAGDLYDSDFKLHIANAKLVDAAGKSLEAADIRYEIDTEVDGDFVSIALRVGGGAAKGKDLEMFGGELEEVHYDFTLRRLNAKTLAGLMTAIKESYSKPPVPGVSAEISAYGPIKQRVMDLFEHDPELAIDRIGLATKDGEAYLQGVLRTRGVTEQDLEVGGLGLLAKVEGDFKFQAAQALVDSIEGGADWANQVVEQGLLIRQGEKLVSHIEYVAGDLKVNGKLQAIPGLGAPPPPESTSPE